MGMQRFCSWRVSTVDILFSTWCINFYEGIFSAEFPAGAVPLGTECALVCKENYVPAVLGLRTTHQCMLYGWKDPESSDMICEYNG